MISKLPPEFPQNSTNTDVLGRVARSYGLTQQAFAKLIEIPARSLQRRRETRLNKRESEKVLRYARLFQRAVEVFDDDMDCARQFLTEPQPALDGVRPIDFARSEIGAAEIMDLLGRIDHGVYT